MKALMTSMSEKRRRHVDGLVVSDKMDKTVVVRVNRKALHPVYRKYIVTSKTFKVHDQNNDARIGDTVRIVESRPISKQKKWCLHRITQKGNNYPGASL